MMKESRSTRSCVLHIKTHLFRDGLIIHGNVKYEPFLTFQMESDNCIRLSANGATTRWKVDQPGKLFTGIMILYRKVGVAEVGEIFTSQFNNGTKLKELCPQARPDPLPYIDPSLGDGCRKKFRRHQNKSGQRLNQSDGKGEKKELNGPEQKRAKLEPEKKREKEEGRSRWFKFGCVALLGAAAAFSVWYLNS